MEEARIHIQDAELRRLLALTTADLRFADYLLKHVMENREDVFLDGTGWEGGDEWIRAQFGLYVHALLSSALQEGRRLRQPHGHMLGSWNPRHLWVALGTKGGQRWQNVTPPGCYPPYSFMDSVTWKSSAAVQPLVVGTRVGHSD